jgi:hypothetical protein
MVIFQSVFSRLDCWLRNKPYPEPAFYACDDVFDSLFEDNDPWQTRVYWYVRRHVKWTIEWPRDTYYRIKWTIQRARHGWSDRDGWSVDYTLNRLLPPALKNIRDKKHGMPMEFFTKADCDKNWNPTKGGWKRAEKRYKKVFNAIIAGFEANTRMCELDYEAEIGEYPLRRAKGVAKEVQKARRDEYMKKQMKLIKRDKKISEKGLLLFAKYYNCLSD